MWARSADLALARLLGQDHALAAGALELVVAAGVEGELAALEMAGLLRHRVEEVAVVADQDQRARVAAQMLLEPDRGLEVEMVGGLVEQQEVGLEEQHAGQRHAHPPAAGEGVERPVLLLVVEAQALEDAGGARGCGVGADLDQPLVQLGDAHRVGRGLGLGQQGRRARCRRRARPRAG